jgi:hypothetical protein
MAALLLRNCPCLAPASKNQVQPSSGCRQGGAFSSNLATALCYYPVPATHPRPRCSTETNRRRPYGRNITVFSLVSSTCKQKSRLTQLGMPTRGRFQLKPRHCPLSFFCIRHPPKTSLFHQNERKEESRSTQLGVPTRGRFCHISRHFPLSLPCTRHPPKTPLLSQNKPPPAVQ